MTEQRTSAIAFPARTAFIVHRPVSWLPPDLAALSKVPFVYALVDAKGEVITYSAWVTDVLADAARLNYAVQWEQ